MKRGRKPAEEARLREDALRKKNWKRWGPYLSERQWGTVREDYSPDGNPWEYFPLDHARSRAYRWGEDGMSVIAGYHWFGDWGRDTMIALSGLTIPTGRTGDAATILRTFARFADRGMLPNRFPDAGEGPEYNTADATIWYFEAIRACHEATGDDSLRPNQLLAVSLPHSPLPESRQKSVVDACARELLTPLGLRSLSPGDPRYVGHYVGGPAARDAAYHQGTVWPWLIGPFVTAHLRVYRDPLIARSFLLPLLRHLGDHGLGSICEIADDDPPFTPRGCIAQAWSVAETLHALFATRAG